MRVQRKQATIWHFIVVIIDPSLHHSGPGLPVLSCAPLVWYGGGLKLHYDLTKANRSIVTTTQTKLMALTAPLNTSGTWTYLWIVHDYSLS